MFQLLMDICFPYKDSEVEINLSNNHLDYLKENYDCKDLKTKETQTKRSVMVKAKDIVALLVSNKKEVAAKVEHVNKPPIKKKAPTKKKASKKPE